MPTLAALALLLLVPAIPPPPADDEHVVDTTGSMTEEGIAAAEAVADEWQGRTANDVVVAVVPTLEGLTVEAYTAELLASWPPRAPGVGGRVAIVIATDDLSFRVDADAALEPVLDEEAAAAVAATAGPALSARDFDAAVLQLVDGVVRAVDAAGPGGAPTTAEPTTTTALGFDPDDFEVADRSDGASAVGWVLLAALGAVVYGAYRLGRRRSGLARTGDGGGPWRPSSRRRRSSRRW